MKQKENGTDEGRKQEKILAFSFYSLEITEDGQRFSERRKNCVVTRLILLSYV